MYFCSLNQDLKKMRDFLLTVILSTLCFCGFAQNKGSLQLNQDDRIDRLKQRQREVYSENNTTNGYRVQIFMEIGNEAVDHAQATKASFSEAFPGLPVYLSYEQPYYRLRVGDFRNRVEAEKYLRLIKPRFNLAFVTADVINPPAKLEPVDLEALEDGGEENGENYQE